VLLEGDLVGVEFEDAQRSVGSLACWHRLAWRARWRSRQRSTCGWPFGWWCAGRSTRSRVWRRAVERQVTGG